MSREDLRGIRPEEASDQNGGSLGTIDRLNQLIVQNPERYALSTVARVRAFVNFEMANPDRQKPMRLFQEVDDFHLYFQLRPEWHEKSVKALSRDTKSGAGAFYEAFTLWVKKVAPEDRQKQEQLKDVLFPHRKISRGHLTSIEDWIAEFEKHPEWAGKSGVAMIDDREGGGGSFYKGFNHWLERHVKDKEERKKLRERLFPKQKYDWSSLKTLDQWIEAFNAHPQWLGRGYALMVEDKESGSSSFFQTFAQWVRKEAQGDKAKEKELILAIFPRRNEYRQFTTIGEWEKEFNTHPEWHGRSSGEMIADRESGANAFYASFLRWTRTIGDSKMRFAYKRRFFSNARRKYRSEKSPEPYISSNPVEETDEVSIDKIIAEMLEELEERK